ncbi:MAG: motility protein A [Limnochordia bacterium]|jgi:chemotaxis protein MotA|nr:MAG: flagellar motor protein MotP [Peptococcaceae bacterium 1109]
MDTSSMLGILMGTILLLVGMILEGDLRIFWSFSSILIVFGGTFASVMINFSMDQVRSVFSLVRIAFSSKAAGRSQEIISTLVNFAEVSRREGLLSLEERAQTVDEPFLQKGIQLVVDGTDPELVRSILEIELVSIEERHRIGHRMFDQMGAWAPAYGMIGTLIGLIVMLSELDNPDLIGSGMAVALITTFYGSVASNLIFLPIAGKLRIKTEEEILMKQIMIEGILSIQAGENPRIVEEKLKSFFPANQLAQPGRSEVEAGAEGVTVRA